jgi:hypothetical protein
MIHTVKKILRLLDVSVMVRPRILFFSDMMLSKQTPTFQYSVVFSYLKAEISYNVHIVCLDPWIMKHKVASKRRDMTTIAAASYAEERNLQTNNFLQFRFFYARKYCFRTETFTEYRVFQEEILIFFLRYIGTFFWFWIFTGRERKRAAWISRPEFVRFLFVGLGEE